MVSSKYLGKLITMQQSQHKYEEIPVYILETNNDNTYRVIGIIHRNDENTDILVAATDGQILNQADILEAVHDLESSHDISVCPLYHKSCGAIVYRINKQREYLLLLQEESKTWSFPKGHMERGETEEETAHREILEETGLVLNFQPGFRAVAEYAVDKTVSKEVVLFLARSDEDPHICIDEISLFCWVDAEEAKKLLYEVYADIIDGVEKLENI